MVKNYETMTAEEIAKKLAFWKPKYEAAFGKVSKLKNVGELNEMQESLVGLLNNKALSPEYRKSLFDKVYPEFTVVVLKVMDRYKSEGWKFNFVYKNFAEICKANNL